MRRSDLALVISREQPMLVGMGFLSWCRRWWFRSPQPLAISPRNAAENGDADAQFALGLKYCTSGVTSRDFVQAAAWYQKAADQDHALAQFNLGLMLSGGQGVPQDSAAGLTWIRRAAEGGDAGAQFNLGTSYHRSSVHHSQMDCAESRIEAYKWFHLAAVQGYKGSEAALERVTMSMTREEVVDGGQRAAAFVVKKPFRNQIALPTVAPA